MIFLIFPFDITEIAEWSPFQDRLRAGLLDIGVKAFYESAPAS